MTQGARYCGFVPYGWGRGVRAKSPVTRSRAWRPGDLPGILVAEERERAAHDRRHRDQHLSQLPFEFYQTEWLAKLYAA